MRILIINSVCGIRSTGRICSDIATKLEAEGHEVKIAYGREWVPEKFQKYAVRIGSDTEVMIHALRARFFDTSGIGSKRATMRFIRWVKEYDPDVIHLHNIHGYYIHIGILFDYLRYCGKRIVWTLHDCWAFTGHCCYFDYIGCNKWNVECRKCQQKREYPACLAISRCRKNFNFKKVKFVGIPNLSIVTPSYWLASLVEKSFLCQYEVKVIHNGIDTTRFKYFESDIKKKLGIPDKKVVLGVAADWGHRKGLQDFIELSDILPDDYCVVLVGMTEKQISNLPQRMIGIPKTNDIQEIINLYSAAHVFVNLTYEDNYPTTNLEARACGTPVITYRTGGSPESAGDEAVIVEKGKVDTIRMQIEKIAGKRLSIINYHEIDINTMIREYLQLIERRNEYEDSKC